MPGVKPLATLFLIPCFLAGAELRLGIIGGDGAEAIAFTRILNDVSDPDHAPGGRVIAAFRGGRIDKAGEELRAKWKVEITPDIGSLCRRVDGVLILSGESGGRAEQIKIVIAAGKPMFLESPLAETIEGARAIIKLAKNSGVPWFSASAMRFGEIAEIRGSYLSGATTWGPGPMAGVEMLYGLMGTGCEEVVYKPEAGVEVAAGRWPGRVGSVRSAGPENGWGALVVRSKESQRHYKIGQDYRSLLVEVVKFFQTSQPPVSSEETLEILAFLDAAQRSKAAGGTPVKLR